MADDVIIRVEGLSAGYDDTTILENVSFDVMRGEVFVILGGSGCGALKGRSSASAACSCRNPSRRG